MSDDAIVVSDERRPGIEVLELQNSPGYGDEHMMLSNSRANGLRFQIWEDTAGDDPGTEIAHFHISSPATALLIANRLREWAGRICEPPHVDEAQPPASPDTQHA